MEQFSNIEDGGRQLGGYVRRYLYSEPDEMALTVAPITPNGVPVLAGMRDALPEHSMSGLLTDRSSAGCSITVMDPALITGRRVIVIDDGVETGTAARAAYIAVRALDPGQILLAVPVCPRQTMAELALHYDDIIAVQTPLGRRALRWHFQDFDTIDERAALDLLAAMRGTSASD